MGSKILVADDSITIQKVIGLTFANEDFELVSADNGDEALEKTQATPPDLIIADTNMPGLSGYDLCERIRATAELAHIPLILLTGTYEVFDEDRAEQVGANDYLTKPFESQILIDKVKTLLAQPAPAAPAESAPAAEATPEPEAAEPEDFDDVQGIASIETVEEVEEIEAIEPEIDAGQAEADAAADSMDFSDINPAAEPVAEAEPVAQAEAVAEAEPVADPEPVAETDFADEDIESIESFDAGIEETAQEPSPGESETSSAEDSGDVDFASLADSTSEDTVEAESGSQDNDWNMEEFENYLANENEGAETSIADAAKTPAPAAEEVQPEEIEAAPAEDFEDIESIEATEDAVEPGEEELDDSFDEAEPLEAMDIEDAPAEDIEPEAIEFDDVEDSFEEVDVAEDAAGETGDADSDVFAEFEAAEAASTESATEAQSGDTPEDFEDISTVDIEDVSEASEPNTEAIDEFGFPAAQNAPSEVAGSEEPVGEIEPEPIAAESFAGVTAQQDDDSVDLSSHEDGPVEHNTMQELEQSSAAQYETTFDVDPSDYPSEELTTTSTESGAPTPAPAETSINSDEIQSLVNKEVQAALGSALDEKLAPEVQAQVQTAVENAVNSAVETAVSQVKEQILDEIRRRLS